MRSDSSPRIPAPLPLQNAWRLLEASNIQGFIIPKTDPHHSEYGPERDNVVAYLTEFTGSAGLVALCTPHKRGALFVDGRYTRQAQQEVDPTFFDYGSYGTQPCIDWLTAHLHKGDRIGFCPEFLSKGEYDRYQSGLASAGIELIPLPASFLQEVWPHRPAIDTPEIVPHPLLYSGLSLEQKIEALQEQMALAKTEAVFINYAESCAWLFNIRAPERLGTPAPLAYAYIPVASKPTLFIHPQQVTTTLLDHLHNSVNIAPYDEVFSRVSSLASQTIVALDPTHASMAMVYAVESQGGAVQAHEDFCALPRACKNETERRGMIDAHIRDGVALCDFLAWLDTQDLNHQPLTELDVMEILYGHRQRQSHFKGYSFETIAGSGPHGAIIHYRATPKTNRRLLSSDILLLDSGAQYIDGTTDVTRTLALNKAPTPEQKDRYTRVLKGHIALASALFPEGTTGSQLDTLARQSLWQIGCDYAHGTGHGVGSYLGVHEGPQNISSRPNPVPLGEGMVVSNEPGYYKEGQYGIRIESLLMVLSVPQDQTCDDKPMLCFQTLTLVPLDGSFLAYDLLTAPEIQWINEYHQRIRATLLPLVLPETRTWLEKMTAPISA